MGFVESFLGTCRGTEVFRSLRKHSFLRTFWHLFLMVLLCGTVIAIGNYFMLKYYWRNTQVAFSDIFGSGVRLSEKGIYPELYPDVSRRQELPFNGLLVYVSPKGPEKNYPDITLKDRNFILLWTPAGFGLAVRTRDGKWAFSNLQRGTEVELHDHSATLMDYVEFRKLFDQAVQKEGKSNWSIHEKWGETIYTGEIFHCLRISCAVFNGIMYLLHGLFMILLSSLLLTLLFGITGAPKQMGLLWSEVFRISVYAAFPVLAVITLLPTFSLPFAFAYDWIFLLCWFIYTAAIFRHLQKYPDDVNKKEKQNEFGR